MKPSKFEYFAPSSIAGAISLMAEHAGDARFLAGGQSLVPMMNFRVAAPAALIDLNGVSELSEVVVDGNGALHIGAMTRTRRLETDPAIADANPLLSAAAMHIAHFQIRNRGTIGGSLAHADPAAELPGIALACDAEICLRGPDGERVIKAADFFEGVFTTVAREAELIEKIYFPPWPEERIWAFGEISRRDGDFALVGIAAWYDTGPDGLVSDCRIAAIGAGDTPVRLKSVEAGAGRRRSVGSAVRTGREGCRRRYRSVDDLHASAAYRREVAQVLTARMLTEASGR